MTKTQYLHFSLIKMSISHLSLEKRIKSSVRFPSLGESAMNQNQLEERLVSSYNPRITLCLRVVRSGAQGRSMEAGTEGKTVEEICIQTFSPSLGRPIFPTTIYRGRALLTLGWPLQHQWLIKTMPSPFPVLPAGQSDGGGLSTVVPRFADEPGLWQACVCTNNVESCCLKLKVFIDI